MMKKFLDQLAEDDVPKMPSELDANLHHRINNRLFGQQVLEVMCFAIPYGLFHYLHALAGAACFSVSGRYPEIRNPKTQNPENQDPETGEDHASRDPNRD